MVHAADLHSCFLAACLVHGCHLTLDAVCTLHHILPFFSEYTCCMSRTVQSECLLTYTWSIIHQERRCESRHAAPENLPMHCEHALSPAKLIVTERLGKGSRPTQGMLLAVLFKPLMLSLVLLANLRRSAEKAAMVSCWPVIVRAPQWGYARALLSGAHAATI